MESSAPTPESFEQQVLSRLDTLSDDVERLRVDSERVASDVEASNARFEKWDGWLWGLTLGLIGTTWTAIFAASAVVITRILSGQ
ncbi:hypothetical protein VB780_30055 [Leptolyngbya sp. CCNP1308]|uniref:hypothetical protein n=1 Tax=Leptolyngbya sp. CCNP1308 TaxID=3110255 RepID=UPI002B21D3E7|nr:hypothetical protein [Leptolyngbya sp. CCNP1308]MEA5452853.1 hypothetical protein [Leptolyngbya sp. CCNP1308]